MIFDGTEWILKSGAITFLRLNVFCICQGLGKIYKGQPAGLDVLNADTLRTARSSKTCRHCSPGNVDYRSIIVKILPVKGRKKDDVTQILLLEVQGADREDEFDLPPDFWDNIKVATSQDEEAEVPKTHVLTPSEVTSLLLISVFFCMIILLEFMRLEDMKCTLFLFSVLSTGSCMVMVAAKFSRCLLSTFFLPNNTSV